MIQLKSAQVSKQRQDWPVEDPFQVLPARTSSAQQREDARKRRQACCILPF
jgi:hypothetical protein